MCIRDRTFSTAWLSITDNHTPDVYANSCCTSCLHLWLSDWRSQSRHDVVNWQYSDRETRHLHEDRLRVRIIVVRIPTSPLVSPRLETRVHPETVTWYSLDHWLLFEQCQWLWAVDLSSSLSFPRCPVPYFKSDVWCLVPQCTIFSDVSPWQHTSFQCM